MPLVSVIMPAYNAEKYIQEAINSILHQTFADYELIIIDDCSNDNTVNIIKSINDSRILLYKNDYNMGVAASLNKGLDLAKGKYVARMDADDISLPNRLEKQVVYMDENPDVVICGSNVKKYYYGEIIGEVKYPIDDDLIKTDLLFGSPFAHPTVIIRNEVLKKHGFHYETEYEKVEDYRLWIKMIYSGKYHNLDEALLLYRIHSEQIMSVYGNKQREGRIRISAELLPEIGIVENESIALVVDAFLGTKLNQQQIVSLTRIVLSCKNRLKSNTYSKYNKQRIMDRFKSVVIDCCLKSKCIPPSYAISITGIKAYIYLIFYNFFKKV